MRSTTVRLDADIDPFTVGARSGLLWSRTNADDPVPVLAGVGELVRLRVDRPGGAADAQARLAELSGPNEVGGSGTGPVAFAAFPFDRERRGEMVVPEIVVGRGADGRRWLTTFSDEPDSVGPGARSAVMDAAVDRVRAMAEMSSSGPQATTFELNSVLAPETWRDEVVATVRDRIRSGALDKAVVARELRFTTDHPIDRAAVVERLRNAYPAAILFSVDGFVGASPELLVSRHGDVVRAHPLAGTAPRSSDPATDQGLAAGLLASAKDRWEHRITIDWLLDGLLPFCSYVDAEPEPSIVSLANVHHLGTRVEGRLSSPPTSVLELVAALHPTPAVGGDPQAAALELIAEVECAERGRYAGPVGWLDAEGNGALAVGIRSAELSDTGARIFAGVGVVAGSDPEAELAETRSKFRAMLGALVQP